MPAFLLALGLSLSTVSFADLGDPYSFIKNFSLNEIVQDGSKIKLSLNHDELVAGKAQFDLIESAVCSETVPARCSAIIVRYDLPTSWYQKATTSTFEIDLKDVFGYDEGVEVTIIAPNKTMRLKY